jgi:dynactin 1
MTSENEQEQRRRIAEMEKDMTGIDDLQCTSDALALLIATDWQHRIANYESTLIKLTNAEVQIEDLKVQLDDALGAEEMLVQLTERNLMLGEVWLRSLNSSSRAAHSLRQKIEEMRITIEDLEALKELNDELEENHVETEKAMQEDLGEEAFSINSSPVNSSVFWNVDLKDVHIRDQQRKIESLEEACQDLDGTIGQFRELVMNLQKSVYSMSLSWYFI